jgi:hypothetical protein
MLTCACCLRSNVNILDDIRRDVFCDDANRMAKTRFGHNVTYITLLTGNFEESIKISKQRNLLSKKRQKTAAVDTEQPHVLIDFACQIVTSITRRWAHIVARTWKTRYA